MEEQEQLYQLYYQPEKSHKLGFMPEKTNYLKYQNKSYNGQINNAYVSIDTNRMLSISLGSLTRSSSKCYVALTDDESTPLLSRKKRSCKLTRYRKGVILLTLFILFYAGFLAVGSVTFRFFELNEELKERQYFRDVRQGFLTKYPSILGSIFVFFIFRDF